MGASLQLPGSKCRFRVCKFVYIRCVQALTELGEWTDGEWEQLRNLALDLTVHDALGAQCRA